MNFKKFLPWIMTVVIIGGYSYVKGIIMLLGMSRVLMKLGVMSNFLKK
jgi:hypothetical protein